MTNETVAIMMMLGICALVIALIVDTNHKKQNTHE